MLRPRALFLGTCRIIYPADHLRAQGGLPVRRIRHRVHAPRQVEALVETLLGRNIYDDRSAHLLSDAAHADLIKSGSNEITLAYLENERARMQSYDAFAIEISSLTEFELVSGDFSMCVNTFTKRDLDKDREEIDRLYSKGIVDSFPGSEIRSHRHDTRSAIDCMRRIKVLLGGRPILWVSHANIENVTPEMKSVWVARTRLSQVLELGARTLGDKFYDPTGMVHELGQSSAFEKSGSDIYHYTQDAIKYLGSKYWGLVLSDHESVAVRP